MGFVGAGASLLALPNAGKVGAMLAQQAQLGEQLGAAAGTLTVGTSLALATAVTLWSLSNNVVSPSLLTGMNDQAAPRDVPQALSLLRSCGDVGVLVGASSVGMLAASIGYDNTFYATGVGMLGTAAVLAVARRTS